MGENVPTWEKTWVNTLDISSLKFSKLCLTIEVKSIILYDSLLNVCGENIQDNPVS